MNDYHDTPIGPDLPADTESVGPLSVDTDGTIRIHESGRYQFGGFPHGQQVGKTNAIAQWAAGIRRMFEWNKTKAAASAHLSREASRYSTSPRPKPVVDMMAVYARQRGLRIPEMLASLSTAAVPTLAAVVYGGVYFTGPQCRRIKKKLNRLKGHIPA